MIQRDDRLSDVHKDLVDVVRKASIYVEFDILIVEGSRTKEKQKTLVAKGASKTMNSRHIPSSDGYARAIDVAPIIEKEVRWDWPLFHTIAAAMKKASRELEIPIEWGGDWVKFKDGPHFQLPWKDYP